MKLNRDRIVTREEFISECKEIFLSPPFLWTVKEAGDYAISMAEVYYDDDPTWEPWDAIQEDRYYWD